MKLQKKDTFATSPRDKDDLLSYLRLEEEGSFDYKSVRFVRTGQKGLMNYWLYRFQNSESEGWVFVSQKRLFGIALEGSCVGSWGDPNWTEDEVLEKYHGMSNR